MIGKLNIAGEVIHTGSPTTDIDWNNVDNKPFSQVDTEGGLAIYDDTLMIDTLDTIATINYVDGQVDGITTTLASDYATKDEIPEITVTQTLSSGTEIGSIDVDGTTTVLYAPAGASGATPSWTAESWQDGYIDNKPAIWAGTGTRSIVEGGLVNTASGFLAHAEGGDATCASGGRSHAENSGTTASGHASHAEGFNTIAASWYQHAQGKLNIEDNQDVFADIVGNGYTTTVNSTVVDVRDNAEATDWNGNKYLAGDVYVGVTNWGTTPTLGASKLAKEDDIPQPDGNTIVDNNGVLSTIVGGGYAEVDISSLISSSISLSRAEQIANNLNRFYLYTGDNLDDIIDIVSVPDENITVACTIAGSSTTAALKTYIGPAIVGVFGSIKSGYLIEGFSLSNAYQDKQVVGLIKYVSNTTGTIYGLLVAQTSTSTLTISLDSVTGNVKEREKISSDWIEPYFPLEDRIFVGDDTSKAIKIISSNPSSMTNSVAIGTSANIQANYNSLAFGAAYESNGQGIIKAHGTSAYSTSAGYGGGALAFGKLDGNSSNIIAFGNGTLAFGESKGSNEIGVHGPNGASQSTYGSMAFGYSDYKSIKAVGTGCLAAGYQGSYGSDNNATDTISAGDGSIAFGGSAQALKNYSQALGWHISSDSPFQMSVGKWNIVDSNSKYNFIVGNGTSSGRSNAFAAGADGNIYTAGSLYANVSDWSNPTTSGTKMAVIPEPPTTNGTYTLQATVSDGVVTYSWI